MHLPALWILASSFRCCITGSWLHFVSDYSTGFLFLILGLSSFLMQVVSKTPAAEAQVLNIQKLYENCKISGEKRSIKRREVSFRSVAQI